MKPLTGQKLFELFVGGRFHIVDKALGNGRVVSLCGKTGFETDVAEYYISLHGDKVCAYCLRRLK